MRSCLGQKEFNWKQEQSSSEGEQKIGDDPKGLAFVLVGMGSWDELLSGHGMGL